MIVDAKSCLAASNGFWVAKNQLPVGFY